MMNVEPAAGLHAANAAMRRRLIVVLSWLGLTLGRDASLTRDAQDR